MIFFLGRLSGAQATNQAPTTAAVGSTTKVQITVFPPVLSPAVGEQYTRPHELIDVGGGRKINLFCMGQGATTVVFDSGLSDWSSIWALVQPGVAKSTRACSYDRAGMGYSDPSDIPRSPIAIVEDLHTLLRAAKIEMPVVLVGHSLGGFNMKLYGALYPQDVSGLVLVDPSEDRAFERVNAILTAKYGAAGADRIALQELTGITMGTAFYNQCAAASVIKDLDPASDQYKGCSDPVRTPLGPDIAAARQIVQVKRAYQVAQASEFTYSVYGDSKPDLVYARLFSGQPFAQRPLIVLTHSFYDIQNPDETEEFFALNTLHDQTAALSQHGVNRIVSGSHHNIEVDQPQAIIDAVAQVLKEVIAQ
jgi:pimeloyl-ACP methyl ester carboxylesterase